MNLSERERKISDSLAKAFEKISIGDITGARRQTHLLKYNFDFDSEELKSLLRRMRL